MKPRDASAYDARNELDRADDFSITNLLDLALR
ncbi:hypothetical protein X769_28340 [Mesorhizobium sp. LSJC268A00]|nr:hypothetical protein X769_28340 [Mesorhizobium sp. LSJC268A00]